jgi:hypothetical protein
MKFKIQYTKEVNSNFKESCPRLLGSQKPIYVLTFLLAYISFTGRIHCDISEYAYNVP